MPRAKKLQLKPGSKVMIPKGIKVKQTHPGKQTGPNGRQREVTIHHIIDGDGRSKPSIAWTGDAGYFCSVKIADLQKAIGRELKV